jgi:hypothetical protein
MKKESSPKNTRKKLKSILRKTNMKQNLGIYIVRHRCYQPPKPQVFALYLDAEEYVTERRKPTSLGVRQCTNECRVMPKRSVRALAAHEAKVAA